MKTLLEHIRQTLSINPALYSQKVSENRAISFGYALAGIFHMLRYAKNVRIQIVATIIVLGAAWVAELSLVEWSIIILVMGLNWFAEFVNAAIEGVVNLAAPDYHPIAQVTKDIAAGAVLVMTFVAVMIGLLLLAPPLLDKIIK